MKYFTSIANRKNTGTLLGILLTVFLIFWLASSIDAGSGNSLQIKTARLFSDLLYSFVRVTAISLIACLIAIMSGFVIKNLPFFGYLSFPVINFIRHISPFAWFPFAIIWLGLGEKPVLFILFVTLTFPALIAVKEQFETIPKEYYDEAHLCGAGSLQIFWNVELPLISVSLVNFFRILWGLGWTAVIAAEMLGTSVGLGYSLLDFRYLLFYNEMLLYIIVMGVVGILTDWLLGISVKYLKLKTGM